MEAMSFWKTPRIGCKCGTSSAADLRRNACSAGTLTHACREHAWGYCAGTPVRDARRTSRVDRRGGLFVCFGPLLASMRRPGRPHICAGTALPRQARREPTVANSGRRPIDRPCLQQPHERRYVPRPLPQRRRDERLQTNEQTNNRRRAPSRRHARNEASAQPPSTPLPAVRKVPVRMWHRVSPEPSQRIHSRRTAAARRRSAAGKGGQGRRSRGYDYPEQRGEVARESAGRAQLGELREYLQPLHCCAAVG